ncbi:Uncharacterized protein dnm_024860 [Desulfonema magnum]|uniref:Uncharacterized protein n=1 Tax=Desulfonema magnum TaxID=45655 RepID=A0A975BJG9_9BACT|nr:Uncharacterized protein dnm_024860 [Desulfonema magnum]
MTSNLTRDIRDYSNLRFGFRPCDPYKGYKTGRRLKQY